MRLRFLVDEVRNQQGLDHMNLVHHWKNFKLLPTSTKTSDKLLNLSEPQFSYTKHDSTSFGLLKCV